MPKKLLHVLGAMAVLGATLLTTTAASAAPNARADPCPDGTSAPACDTTVTFTVTSGALSISAPVSAGLSAATPGNSATGTVGPVVVTDDRAALNGTWTVTASSTNFTTGTASPAETIPVGDATYAPGAFTTTGTTGTVTPTAHNITLSGTAQDVVTSTVNGNNVVSWNPTETVAVPGTAVGGVYTSTLTQSTV